MISDEEDPKDKLGALLSASLIPRLSNVRVDFDKDVIVGLTPLFGEDNSIRADEPFSLVALFSE